MRYKKEHFNNAPRSKFLKALSAEGISLDTYLSNGLHKEPWVDHILNPKSYQKMYSPARLKQYRDEMSCPVCDNTCGEMVMIWASGPLLGTKEDMDAIINAIMKVFENRDKLNSI